MKGGCGMMIDNFFEILSPDETNFVFLYFFRYCLPRHTYMVGVCCETIKNNLESLKETTKTTIIKEIEEYLSRDSDRKIFDRMDDKKWSELLDVIKEKINLEYIDQRKIECRDLDLVFASVVRYCLFYGKGNKEKVFELFGKIAECIPGKSISIIERDIRRKIRDDFALLQLTNEEKEFWKIFYKAVYTNMKYRWIEQWD